MKREATRRPLRILLVSNHRRFKINFRAHPWARELADRGHDVDVMCHADTERWRTRIEHVDGFRIVESPDLLFGALRQGWDPVCAYRRYAFLMRENKSYDIIHCLDTRLAVIWPALAYAKAKGIPIVSDWIDWWGRGGLIKERRPWWYKLLFSWIEVFFEEAYRARLDGLTAISNALVERAEGLGMVRDRCLFIPGGANVRAFANVPGKEDAKTALGIAPETPVVCFSGLDVLIDLGMAVRAFELLLELDPSITLLLVGPTETDARSHVAHSQSLANILALGPVSYRELPIKLAAADVFLMPYTNKVSNVGRWPNKIGDYMCVGRPTVSNPVGEVRRLFEKHELGLLTEETPESMAEAAWSLLCDDERSSRIGLNARRVAENDYAWDKLIVSLESWYYDLIEGHLGPLRSQRGVMPAPASISTTRVGAPH
ncbi:MAG: glycosyltransferase family 4 protein [Candidatus Hydrogenedentes bacterium]|nr:glycosyltransferase family 4 protein [Candidatus Hydrogenedentota bacterium]